MDGKLKKAGCLFSAGFFKKVLMMMFVLNVCMLFTETMSESVGSLMYS